MVASHPVDMWQRNQQAYPMSNIYYDPPRSVTNPPSSRGYQQTSNVEMSLPLFSATPLTTSVPYQSGSYAFDTVPVNPYDMQQTYPMGYAADVPQNLSYARSNLVQPMPALQDARSVYSANQYSSKSATASPLQSSPSYHRSSYDAELERPRSEPVEGTNIHFSTDVDTLMKAIQARQPEPKQAPQGDKVRFNKARVSHGATLTQMQEEGPKSSQKPRKRYQCNMPGCNKSFYQKTHLEIHVRAHTGAKPFVSRSHRMILTFANGFRFAKHRRVVSAFHSSVT